MSGCERVCGCECEWVWVGLGVSVSGCECAQPPTAERALLQAGQSPVCVVQSVVRSTRGSWTSLGAEPGLVLVVEPRAAWHVMRSGCVSVGSLACGHAWGGKPTLCSCNLSLFVLLLLLFYCC